MQHNKEAFKLAVILLQNRSSTRREQTRAIVAAQAESVTNFDLLHAHLLVESGVPLEDWEQHGVYDL
jgi:hypothetical protein